VIAPAMRQPLPDVPYVPIMEVIGGDTVLHRVTKHESAGPCPICKDGTDRFRVDEHTNKWWCRQCSPTEKWQSPADYLTARYGLSFREAADRLREYRGGVTPAPPMAVPTTEPPKPAHRRSDATYYPYTDAAGKEVGLKERRDLPGGEKTFAWLRPDPASPTGYYYGLEKAARPLYRQQEVSASPAGAQVFLVEGEKCTDAVVGLGLLATTSPDGAGSWQPGFAEPLRGKQVVVMPDNDLSGRRYAEAACSSLHGVAASVRVLDLPNLGDHGDVADWLARGGDRATLETYAAAAPQWHPVEEAPPHVGVPKPSQPKLDPTALHGVAGEIVRAIAPHSEADEAALLITLLTFAGAIIGHAPHALAGGSRHTVNNNVAIVGDTGKGRKGSSLGPIRRLMVLIDPKWCSLCMASGLSSGEGLIYATRDPSEKRDKEGALLDPGAEDKRLLVVEEELASVLKVMGREGNTLSAIVRQAWDHGDLRVLTRNNPIRATGAHISILGHITQSELQRYLTETESANGFANRFAWIYSCRSKLLPEGGGIPDYAAAALRLKETIVWAEDLQAPISRDEDARSMWHTVYGPLSDGKPGLLGAVLGRAEAHVLRYSVLYALLDRSPVVRVPHLEAALALWDYAEASARYIFGDRLGDPIADAILAGMQEAGQDGMDKTAIHNLFGRHQTAARIQVALEQLIAGNLVRADKEKTAGAPRTVYRRAGS